MFILLSKSSSSWKIVEDCRNNSDIKYKCTIETLTLIIVDYAHTIFSRKTKKFAKLL